jgi:hypothetical protein
MQAIGVGGRQCPPYVWIDIAKLDCKNAIGLCCTPAVECTLDREMKARTKTIRTLCSGMLLGAFLVGAPIYVRGLMREQHYREIERFFEGNVGKREVFGISFFEYTGWGFMAGNKWKVVMQEEGIGRPPVILYEEASVFQESAPHQPTIEIEGNLISIDDGIRSLRINVEESKGPKKAPNRGGENGQGQTRRAGNRFSKPLSGCFAETLSDATFPALFIHNLS